MRRGRRAHRAWGTRDARTATAAGAPADGRPRGHERRLPPRQAQCYGRGCNVAWPRLLWSGGLRGGPGLGLPLSKAHRASCLWATSTPPSTSRAQSVPSAPGTGSPSSGPPGELGRDACVALRAGSARGPRSARERCTALAASRGASEALPPSRPRLQSGDGQTAPSAGQ